MGATQTERYRGAGILHVPRLRVKLHSGIGLGATRLQPRGQVTDMSFEFVAIRIEKIERRPFAAVVTPLLHITCSQACDQRGEISRRDGKRIMGVIGRWLGVAQWIE
ncbi:hypothetical protein AO064_18720 [Pseudomonas marginalis]|uniref:Uncharacterized protein n=1 Tax=Pseudomonas marginalis TaxID=298 RepID=A0A9X5QIU9_PSEMA|nr:hypothetical protein AO064_18720 [Pseudomonas marginalis]